MPDNKVPQSMTREQWMLAQSLAGCLNAANAPFCSDDEDLTHAEVSRDQNYLANVAELLSRLCGPGALQSGQRLLAEAAERSLIGGQRRSEPPQHSEPATPPKLKPQHSEPATPPKLKPFTREQLVFVVDVILASAMDRVAAYLPPNIPQWDYEERVDAIAEMIHGALETVAMAIPVLWAQLNNDGMGVADFYGWSQFTNAVHRYKQEVTQGREVPVPEFEGLAQQIVDFEFADYLRQHKPQVS